MNQKQYADMATIMQFCRIYAEQMYNCMKNSGLLDQGYELSIKVRRWGFPDVRTLTADIELEKDVMSTDPDEWRSTRMDQMKYSGKEWMVYDDPIAEIGSLPPTVHITRTDDRDGMGETSSKPYPPFDLWISSSDDPADVGGGM